MPATLTDVLLGTAALTCVGVIGLFLWRRRTKQRPTRSRDSSSAIASERDQARAESEQKLVSLVFLLSAPRFLELSQVRAAAERAFGPAVELKKVDDPLLSIQQHACFIIQIHDVALGLACVAGPYVEDVADAADRLRVFLCKQAMQEHQAWLAVDQIGDLPDGGPAIAYSHIGRLMSELAGDDCLALICAQTGQMNSYSPELLPLLRGPDPLSALTLQREDKTVHVPGGDEEMLAATAEARHRWPEFVVALKKRRPMQGFTVKVPFQDGSQNEHMWVEVSKLDGDAIHGKLVHEPQLVSNVKLDDEVIVSLNDLEDWLYSDGKRMVGGFTAKVLEGRQ